MSQSLTHSLLLLTNLLEECTQLIARAQNLFWILTQNILHSAAFNHLQNPASELWFQNSQRPTLEKSKFVHELLLGQALEAEFEARCDSAAS